MITILLFLAGIYFFVMTCVILLKPTDQGYKYYEPSDDELGRL